MLTILSMSGQGRRAEGQFESQVGLPRGYVVSGFLAVGIHVGLLFVWPGSLLLEPAEYGVEKGESAVEVMLVAASPTPEEYPTESQDPPPFQEPAESPESIARVAEESPQSVASFARDAVLETTSRPNEIQESIPQPKADSSSATVKAKEKAAIARNDPLPGKGTSPASRSQSTASSTGVLSSKPAYLYNPHPPYPELSRKAGHSGVVILRVSVSESGKVSTLSVIKSSGYTALDERARSAVRRWIFKPARWNGRPVATQVDVPVRFSLDR